MDNSGEWNLPEAQSFFLEILFQINKINTTKMYFKNVIMNNHS